MTQTAQTPPESGKLSRAARRWLQKRQPGGIRNKAGGLPHRRGYERASIAAAERRARLGIKDCAAPVEKARALRELCRRHPLTLYRP